jgi:hypothetical protein
MPTVEPGGTIGPMARRKTTPPRRVDLYSKHEALDRAHLAATFFSDFVADHHFVQQEPRLRAAAEDLAEQLGGFYQLVGNVIWPAPRKRSR